MTATAEGLGALRDLAQAIGIVGADGQLDADWFAAPGDRIGNMLRDASQRAALLRAAGTMLAQNAPEETDALGRRWVPLLANGGVTLHFVVRVDGAATELGIGARLRTRDPDSDVRVYVPLLRFPPDGAVTVALTTATARVTLDADVTIDRQPVAPGAAGLRGLRLAAGVAANGTAPRLSVSLLGLQLPGQSAPEDVELGSDPSQLGDEALRLLSGIVRRAVPNAAGELAEFLALVGVGDDSAIPPLPIADVLATGVAAWCTWLDQLLGDTAAIDAWFDHLARLVGHAAVVVPAAGPGLPHRVQWTLANDWTLAVPVTIGRTPAGAPTLDVGVEASFVTAGAPPGALEFSATLTRITLGAMPSAVGLPTLEVAARLGPATVAAPEDRLVDAAAPAPRIGSLCVGLSLGADRRAALVLAAHDVVIGDREYARLDLTNTQTLAEVAGSAVGDLANQVLGRLGATADAVRVLLGVLAPPNEANWPVPLTTLSQLLANPVRALVSYHARVLDTNRAGYPSVLEPLRALLAPAAVNVPIEGTGDEDTPWRLTIADGVAVVAWTTGATLELGLAVGGTVVDLGGGCPTVTLGLIARLASLSLVGSGGHAFPGAVARITFGARGAVPLQIGDSRTAILADRAGVELRWARDTGMCAALVVPGLAARIDGEQVPLALPTLDANGRLVGDVPWRALELLIGHLLARIEASWADRLTQLLGWVPLERAPELRLALAVLAADPVVAVRAWVLAHVRNGDLAAIVRSLALAITGPAIPGLSAGIYTVYFR